MECCCYILLSLTQSYAGLCFLVTASLCTSIKDGALLSTVDTEKWCVYLKHGENLVHMYRVSGEPYHEF